MAKQRATTKKRGRKTSEPGQLSAAEQVMRGAAGLYISGEHLSVDAIAKKSVSRVTINKLFKAEGKKPTVKVIEDRIIATVLGETRAAIFDYLKKQSRLVAENPLDQLIAVFRAVLEVFNMNPLGMFVAHRLTNLQDDEALKLTLSRVDELLRAARERGQLNEESGRDLVRLRLMLFGILRGLLMLLPAGSTADGGADGTVRAPRAAKSTKAKKPQGAAVTEEQVEVEFLRIIKLHVSDDWKEHVEKYIEAARRA
jgi:AcrR family transcriptional regulator